MFRHPEATKAARRSGAIRSGTVASVDKMSSLLQEARRELASAESRLGQLLERASQIAASAEQEQAELQRFLEEFALEPKILNSSTPRSSTGTGTLLDIDAIRNGIHEVTTDLQ